MILPSAGRSRAVPRRAALLAFCLVAGLGASLGAATPHRVFQKGRAFTPGSIVIATGEAIEFVNDDGDLLHHAYLENDRFSFDTGDQGPGSRIAVTFTKPGTFTVLCGIHPKMKLSVQVK